MDKRTVTINGTNSDLVFTIQNCMNEMEAIRHKRIRESSNYASLKGDEEYKFLTYRVASSLVCLLGEDKLLKVAEVFDKQPVMRKYDPLASCFEILWPEDTGKLKQRLTHVINDAQLSKGLPNKNYHILQAINFIAGEDPLGYAGGVPISLLSEEEQNRLVKYVCGNDISADNDNFHSFVNGVMTMSEMDFVGDDSKEYFNRFFKPRLQSDYRDVDTMVIHDTDTFIKAGNNQEFGENNFFIHRVFNLYYNSLLSGGRYEAIGANRLTRLQKFILQQIKGKTITELLRKTTEVGKALGYTSALACYPLQFEKIFKRSGFIPVDRKPYLFGDSDGIIFFKPLVKDLEECSHLEYKISDIAKFTPADYDDAWESVLNNMMEPIESPETYQKKPVEQRHEEFSDKMRLLSDVSDSLIPINKKTLKESFVSGGFALLCYSMAFLTRDFSLAFVGAPFTLNQFYTIHRYTKGKPGLITSTFDYLVDKYGY